MKPACNDGENLVLESVGEVRGVEQAEGGDGELMARFGLVDGFMQQRRTRPSGITYRVALELQPGAQ